MKILDLIFPPKCACCGELLEYGTKLPFCATCHAEWEYAKIHCDDENFGTAVTVYNHKYVMMENGGYAAYLVKYLPSKRDSAENRLIYDLKNYSYSRTVDFVASEFAALIYDTAPFICKGGSRNSDAVITWIPRSSGTKLKYGFDHMERCAMVLGKKIGIPAKRILIKNSKAREQKRLSHRERQINADESMMLRKGERLDSKLVVLIDDIITTGASVNAAAKLMTEAGAAQIIAITIAATAHDERQKYDISENFNLF